MLDVVSYFVAAPYCVKSHLTLLIREAEPSLAPPGSELKGEWTVEAVVADIPGGPPKADSTSPVPFFHVLERLKTTKREGWRRFGIDRSG